MDQWTPTSKSETIRKNKAVKQEIWNMSSLYLKTFREGFFSYNRSSPEKWKNSHLSLRKISENIMSRFGEIFVYLYFWAQNFPNKSQLVTVHWFLMPAFSYNLRKIVMNKCREKLRNVNIGPQNATAPILGTIKNSFKNPKWLLLPSH